ncbi:MAG: helix-hairpin-helix domain-containing protein [Deltaproteobacteria bacterium]
MITLISFCNLPWWCVLLSWLLPFLLGLLLGWFLWAKFKQMYDNLYKDYNDLKIKLTGLEEELKKCKSLKNDYISEISLLKGRIKELEAFEKENAGISNKQTLKSDVDTGKGFSSGIAADKFAALKQDNLQVIEGIGPKMEELLKKNGINTLSDLASKNADFLRALLDNEGNKYSMIDPTTWSGQALLGRDGRWDDLIDMQKKLDTGRTNQTSEETDSKVEKILVKLGVLKRWAPDDLKAIEGIGPKIEILLHEAGIKTWKVLSETPVERIQEVLDKGGPKFSLADPGTWPKQAKLAAEGRWAEFEEYIEHLNKGKE